STFSGWQASTTAPRAASPAAANATPLHRLASAIAFSSPPPPTSCASESSGAERQTNSISAACSSTDSPDSASRTQSPERQRRGAGAGDIPCGAEHGAGAGRVRIGLPERWSLERDCEPALTGQQQHAGVEPRPPRRARLDELVVLLVDPLLALVVRGLERAR